jgi:hypothetical protein
MDDVDGQRGKSKQPKEVAWTASEFIAHHKSAGWFAGLFAAILAISGLAYVFTKDLISSVTILVAGLLFAMLANRKPRQLKYKLDSSGITIGPRVYPYNSFKSFAVLQEGAIGCVNLLPLKRFMPEISIYFPPEEGDKILDVLSSHLPHDQKEEHQFDRLMKRIKF